jgi:16S rRNA (guanine527-N7)-methyltransferase
VYNQPMLILTQGALKLGLTLTPEQLAQFELFYREIVTWNKKFNLTAITEYEAVQTKHFLDSLTLMLAWQTPPASLLDIGSGAGLPGLPLKIAFPTVEVSLLEATGKKARFIEYAARELNLPGVEILHDRAETAAQNFVYRERFDAVTARAVASVAALAELALPFCRVGGYAIFPKKGDIEGEISEAAYAVKIMGGKLRPTVKIEIEEFGETRYLVIADKVRPTPRLYPRRSGMAQHYPLMQADPPTTSDA